MNWVRTGRIIRADGSSEIHYGAEGSRLVIASWKRPIPHANRSGSWMYTSYFVVRPDGTAKEYHSLKDAKAAAEAAAKDGQA